MLIFFLYLWVEVLFCFLDSTYKSCSLCPSLSDYSIIHSRSTMLLQIIRYFLWLITCCVCVCDTFFIHSSIDGNKLFSYLLGYCTQCYDDHYIYIVKLVISFSLGEYPVVELVGGMVDLQFKKFLLKYNWYTMLCLISVVQ